MSDGRTAFYGPLFGFFQLGLVVAMIPATPKAAQYALFSAVLWAGYRLVSSTTTGEAPVDLAQGSAIATQLMTLADCVFFTEPDSLKDIYHKQNGKITEAPFKQRVKWSLNLYLNARGIGWAHESPHTPSRVPVGTSRWSFASLRLRTAVEAIVLECICYVANASNPFLTDKELLLSNASFKWRALGTLGFAAAGYARIKWMNCLLSAAIVGAGFSKPERWPNLFGPLTDAWSVRQVWGRVWHHLLRKPVKALSTFTTTKIFRMPSPSKTAQGTFWGTIRTFVWLCTAFFITGVVHIAGETMLINRVGFGAFIFFVMQPLGIAMETFTVYLWRLYTTPVESHHKKDPEEDHHQNVAKVKACSALSTITESRPPSWARIAGYLWVALWFTWTLPFMINPMIWTGMFIDSRVDLRVWLAASTGSVKHAWKNGAAIN